MKFTKDFFDGSQNVSDSVKNPFEAVLKSSTHSLSRLVHKNMQ